MIGLEFLAVDEPLGQHIDRVVSRHSPADAQSV
jgi:hypothetical protein